VNNKKGNNHAKDSEHEHFIQGNNRPQTAAYGLLPRKRPAQLERYTPSFEFLFEAGDEGEHAPPYGEPIIPQAYKPQQDETPLERRLG
jgi:hypothetical protein